MRKISRFLYANSDVESYCKKMEDEVNNILTKSYVKCRYDKSGFGRDIVLTITLAKDKSEIPNGIFHNDPLAQIISISSIPSGTFTESGMPEKLSAESNTSTLSVKPITKSYLAFESVKTGWRNKKSTPEGILKHIVEYTKKLKQVVQDNKDRLPEEIANKY